MRRNALAYVAGIVTAFILVAIVEALGHVVFPPPADIDIGDEQSLEELIASLPLGAILSVAIGWAVGAFAGSLVAGRIGTLKPVYFSSIVSGVILAGGITQLLIIPHPTWFVVVSLSGIIAAGVAATFLIPRLRP